VCKALKVKVASLNRIRHSIESQWSCLRSSFEDSGDVPYCRREEMSADATETAVLSSNDERICLKERMP